MAQWIYGIHAVDSLLRNSPKKVQRLLLQEDRRDKRIAALVELGLNQGVSIERVSRSSLDDLVSGRHQGAIALLDDSQIGDGTEDANLWREEQLLAAVDSSSTPVLILVLDGVTDPHNLGACLRSADAAGVDAVVVPKDKSADLTPVVRKVACGAAETVPFVRVTNLSRTLKALQERGVWLYGAAAEAETTIYESDLRGPIALVMGAEGPGMRRLTGETCDFLVKLPMAGDVSSLNVSVASGVCLFEVVRQRGYQG
jgi:23S rRNA (guanosine2251-2'-O)-methyltransferase